MGHFKTLRLADYKKPEFTTDAVTMGIIINPDLTTVSSKVVYRRTAEGQGATELVLGASSPNPGDKDGKEYIQEVLVNGWPLQRGSGYTFDPDSEELRIPVDPSQKDVDVLIVTYVKPEQNDELSGLFKSDSCYVTQCEAEGFRRITPFLDRPDVMAKYTVTINAPRDLCPVLMANGNKIREGTVGDRHHATFEDPFPKPSYLFATANGKLDSVEDVFMTKSGRNVNVRVFTEAGLAEKGRQALNALKMSMKWDEDVFDCEYDLADYNVVAVSKFNAGAMENKGLNVFVDKLILANPEIATDRDYQSIIDVIGHEYFHNWSGNRITLANWFNLSLKEGLTVNREQMFTASTTSDSIERITAVSILRAAQFREDDGPLSHPVMPQAVQAVDNIYTGTVYQKGSEVIRMMGALMRREKFIEGIKHYFKKNDGQAVTINEFIQCMEDVSGLNFSGQFKLWYTQSGRPRVRATGTYNPGNKTYLLVLEQTVPPTKDQPVKQPMYIPVKMGLVDRHGKDIPLHLSTDTSGTPDSGATERVLHFTDPVQRFVFTNVQSKPSFHSLFRDFSALVDIDPGLNEDQLYDQILNDTDGFNRWDAGQKIALNELVQLYNGYLASGQMPPLNPRFIETFRKLATDTTTDPALVSAAMTLPVSQFMNTVRPMNPVAYSAALKAMKETLARELQPEMSALFARTHDSKPYSFDYTSVGKRGLKAKSMIYLTEKGDTAGIKRAHDLYFKADNMTDQAMAMSSLNDHFTPEREAVFTDYYNRFKNDPLVIQRWIALQAQANSDKVFDKLDEIAQNNAIFDFKNPGHVGSLYALGFDQFHRADGKGYTFVAEGVLKMDKINHGVASRLIEKLCNWRDFDVDTQKRILAELERIAAAKDLSREVLDKLSKALPDAAEKKRLATAPAPAP